MNAISTNRKKYFSRPADKLFFTFGLLMLCSEIWKQLTLTFLVGHGVYNLSVSYTHLTLPTILRV